MYCAKCGNKIEDGRTECPYCGASLIQTSASGVNRPAENAGWQAGMETQPMENAGQSTGGSTQPTGNPVSNTMQQEHIPESRQELREYLEQLANVEPHTGKVVRWYGAKWLSKNIYPSLQPGERIKALFHIQSSWIFARQKRECLVLTDRRVLRMDKFVYMKPRTKGVYHDRIYSIEAEPMGNWFYSVFIGEKIQINTADGTLKIRMFGKGAAQELKNEITKYLGGANAQYTNTQYTNAAYRPEKKRSKKGLIIGIAVAVLAVIGGAGLYLVKEDESYIESVQGGTYGEISTPVGVAFDQFFDQCDWSTEETRMKGYRLVTVKGRCYYQETDLDQELCDVTVNFFCAEGNDIFQVENVTVDHRDLTENEINGFLNDVFYRDGAMAAGHYAAYNADFTAAAPSEPAVQTQPAQTETSEAETSAALIEQTEPAQMDAPVSYSSDPVVAEWEQELAAIQETSGIDRSQYVLEWSDVSYVESRQLEGMSYDIARLAVNEIYARHGRMFKDEHLQAYFDSKPWYYGSVEPDQFHENELSELEKENISTIREYMEQVKGQ